MGPDLFPATRDLRGLEAPEADVRPQTKKSGYGIAPGLRGGGFVATLRPDEV
jgi:hypothetical protein